MKAGIAQINTVTGDFTKNIEKILSAWKTLEQKGADYTFTPELALSGYVIWDLFDRPEFAEQNQKAFDTILRTSKEYRSVLVLGHFEKNRAPTGKPYLNVLSWIQGGKRIHRSVKRFLPTYDIYDEDRWFEASLEANPELCQGFLPLICEDSWEHTEIAGKRRYPPLQPSGEDKNWQWTVNASSSPFYVGKFEERMKMAHAWCQNFSRPFVYVNRVGATEEILFDGRSFVLDTSGKPCWTAPSWQEHLEVVDLEKLVTSSGVKTEFKNEMPELWSALVFGIREYFQVQGFKKALIGLSGGMDSALVATLATEALGAENVHGVAMPSAISSTHSLEDAKELAENLGISLQSLPIQEAVNSLAKQISGKEKLKTLTYENLQSRIRGLMLLTLSNETSALILNTGNKSELATGYSTQYGDLIGALSPLGDLYKTRIYELARWYQDQEKSRGKTSSIPERTLTKAPSAELSPGQKDQDTLPPYPELDAFLEAYLERSVSMEVLSAKYSWASSMVSRIVANEFKRRQAPPVLKVSLKAFGVGRRVPLVKKSIAEF